MKRIIITLLSACAVLTSCGTQFDASTALVGGMQAVKAASITDEQIQSYVSQYVQQLDAQNTVLGSNDPYTIRLKKLTSGITSVDGIPLNFKVYKTSDVNAFACADGSVRVYTGLMDLMNDNEVLGVIGHEIGHVALKHSKKQFKHALMTSAVRYAIASAGGVVGTLSASTLGAIGENLSSAQFSQKQETAADDYGYDFLKAHNKNPWAMAMAFEKLQNLSSKSTAGKAASGSSSNSIFSSHPATSTRIERVAKKATADGYTRPSK